MHTDLEHLIHLQDIESRAAAAAAVIAEAPALIEGLDAKLTAARDAVTAAKAGVAAGQDARRNLDRDLIAAQQRVSKYKEQLMAVKTNTEYHAMQHQIAAAEAEVSRLEELVITNMVEADELAAAQKAAETKLKADEAAISRERAAIETAVATRRAEVDAADRERRNVVPQLTPANRELFERVRQARQGIAVARAIDSHCSICHVALRPQVYHRIVRNEQIVQCDSCQRILYYAGGREASASGQAALDAATAREQQLLEGH